MSIEFPPLPKPPVKPVIKPDVLTLTCKRCDRTLERWVGKPDDPRPEHRCIDRSIRPFDREVSHK